MRKLWVIAALILVPATAQAGFTFAGSLGKGGTVSPSAVAPTSIRISPGYSFVDVLRAELGFVMDLPDTLRPFDLQLYPSLVLTIPVIPIYLRAILGVTDLLDHPVHFTYGGGLGGMFTLGPVGLFVEVNVMPVTSRGAPVFVEGRLGVGYFG